MSRRHKGAGVNRASLRPERIHGALFQPVQADSVSFSDSICTSIRFSILRLSLARGASCAWNSKFSGVSEDSAADMQGPKLKLRLFDLPL
jgi:hypothetical protein